MQISGERRFPMGENRIPDDIFKQAVEKAREIETSIFEKRFKDTDKHSFSEKYLERMQILKMRKSEENDAKIVNYSVKKKSTKVKILLIAAIVMLLGTLTVVAEPVKEFIYQLKETIFPDNTDVSFEELGNRMGEEEAIVTPETFVCRKPKKVPDNYKIDYEEYVEVMCDYTVSWLNQDEKTLIYQQVAVGYFDTWSISADGNKAETIGVNGEVAYLLVDKNDYYTILYPCEGYVYSLSGFEEVDVLIEILESTFEAKGVKGKEQTYIPDNTEVTLEEINKNIQSTSKNITSENFEVHQLKNVPEKYTFEYEEYISEMCFYFAEYVDTDNQIIRYQQHSIGHIDLWSITSDGTEAESIAVNGDRGYLLTDEEGYHFILYPYEGYVYAISGYNEVEELVNLLELVFEE